jgi:translation initiation factor 2B subunit (eIF-2B alpha/beta/delta family)
MQWERLVEKIRADNTSGAAELARMAAIAVLEWTDDTASTPLHPWLEELSGFAAGLYMAQPAMAPLFNLVNDIMLAVESPTVQEELRPYVRRVVQVFLEQLTHMHDRLIRVALELLPPGARILTCSYSSTVLAVLLEAHVRQRLSVVFCPESRPMLEGQRLSLALSRAGIAVELGVDAAIVTFAERAAMALVGADSITAGGVVNKLGTTSLALACRHAGIPCYVVADRHKWFPAAAATPAFSQLKPEAEVWFNPPSGVTIWNAYFECTPMTLFSGIVGEDGLRRPEDSLRQLMTMPVAQVLRRGSSGADSCD